MYDSNVFYPYFFTDDVLVTMKYDYQDQGTEKTKDGVDDKISPIKPKPTTNSETSMLEMIQKPKDKILELTQSGRNEKACTKHSCLKRHPLSKKEITHKEQQKWHQTELFAKILAGIFLVIAIGGLFTSFRCMCMKKLPVSNEEIS